MKQTKYVENARKASRSYYLRKRQRLLDNRTKKLLMELYNMDEAELGEKWPETKQILKR